MTEGVAPGTVQGVVCGATQKAIPSAILEPILTATRTTTCRPALLATRGEAWKANCGVSPAVTREVVLDLICLAIREATPAVIHTATCRTFPTATGRPASQTQFTT